MSIKKRSEKLEIDPTGALKSLSSEAEVAAIDKQHRSLELREEDALREHLKKDVNRIKVPQQIKKEQEKLPVIKKLKIISVIMITGFCVALLLSIALKKMFIFCALASLITILL